MSGDLAYLCVADAAELIRAKSLSPVEYATALLARIGRHDDKYNAFIALAPEQALKAARAAEAEITAGRFKPLRDDGVRRAMVPLRILECAVVARPSTSMMSFSA